MQLSKSKLFILILIVLNVKSENLSQGSKCQNNDSSEGSCESIDNCVILRDKLRNGIIHSTDVKVCNNISRLVCCPLETSQINSRFNIDKSFLRNLTENGPKTCGKAVIGFGTVFYGTQIKRGAYPWIAALFNNKDNKFFCGGSLVSEKFVVTAAHCMEGKQRSHVFDPKDIFVILGAHDLEARLEPQRFTSSVRSIHVHHDWNPFVVSFDADIAILELATDVSFNEYIQPICIAAPNSEAALESDGVIVGFGRSEHRNMENIARIITSPIHSNKICANSSDHESLLTHRTFCGGFPNGTNVCEGDSGSGLIVKHNGVYYLRGIVSAALYDTLIGCNINSYSVFTDTLEFYSWITTGTDDKVLLQTTLDENKKLMSKVDNYTSIINVLREETKSPKSSTLRPLVDTDAYSEPGNKQDEFDWKLTKAILNSELNNIVVSPIGTKLLLCLLAEGAGEYGQSGTKEQLKQVLPYNKNLSDAKKYFKDVLESIQPNNNTDRINFASKIFIDSNFNIGSRFKSIIKYNYQGEIENLKFNEASNSAKIINDWVKDVTKGNFEDLVSEDAIRKSTLDLINVHHFEGTLRFQFNNMMFKDFFSAPGSKSKKIFVEHTANFYYFYSRHLNAKILRLPYDGHRFSMFIILPSDFNGIDTVVEKLESNALKNSVMQMVEYEVHVVIPKFKLKTSLNLNNVLKSLGITDIFTDDATLSLLARRKNDDVNLKVSNIFQVSGIVVDGNGLASIPEQTQLESEPREFIADHPFVFYIEDDTTGAKLFAGRVSNPEN